jgi:subtilase family serine protease
MARFAASFTLALFAVLAMRTSAPAALARHAAEPPAARAALRGRFLAPVQPLARLDLVISLAGQRQNEVDRLIAAQNTPGSPLFRRYLTPAQYGAYFGATARAYGAVLASLRARGFVVDETYANRIDIQVHAPAAVVEAYFGTPLDLRDENGRVFVANRYEPQLPPGVAAVAGLDTYLQLHSHHVHGVETAGTTVTGWTPPNIQSVYDLTPLYAKYTGAGFTVIDATVGTVRPNDFARFVKQFGLKATLSQISLKGAPVDNQGESTLDVEYMAAIAPNVRVLLVSGSGTSSSDFVALHTKIVNTLSQHHVVSTSWGACEQSYSLYGSIEQNERLFAQADLEGQWWMAAAGDWGSDDCERTNDPIPAVDYPGSSPHVMSVGGTRVVPSAVLGSTYRGWGSETVWNDPGYGASAGGIGAGGGGVSVLFERPAFQDGVSSGFMREVPDVVLLADLDDLGGYTIFFKGKWSYDWGGTSFAAPEWAGFLALVESRLGKTPISSPRYRLYALGGNPKLARSVFHDIVRGCNDYIGTPGFCAHPGYSAVGGLGSFDGAALQSAY